MSGTGDGDEVTGGRLMSDRSDASDAADSSRSIHASSDRRVARGDHTHAILTEATIELIVEGQPRPTARPGRRPGQVTSVRTVFNHLHGSTPCSDWPPPPWSLRHRRLVDHRPAGGPCHGAHRGDLPPASPVSSKPSLRCIRVAHVESRGHSPGLDPRPGRPRPSLLHDQLKRHLRP